MDANVIWQQGMHFTGTANTGYEVPLGAEAEAGGANDGFQPLELMAVSLAGWSVSFTTTRHLRMDSADQ